MFYFLEVVLFKILFFIRNVIFENKVFILWCLFIFDFDEYLFYLILDTVYLVLKFRIIINGFDFIKDIY